MPIKVCGQVNIPTVNNEVTACTNFYDTDCVIYQNPISYFGTTEPSTSTEVFNFIISSLQDARNRIISLETNGVGGGGGTGIEADGTFTTAVGGDFVVNHNLGYVPDLQRITITKLNSTNTVAPNYFVDSVTDTTLTINVSNVTDTVEIGWKIFGTGGGGSSPTLAQVLAVGNSAGNLSITDINILNTVTGNITTGNITDLIVSNSSVFNGFTRFTPSSTPADINGGNTYFDSTSERLTVHDGTSYRGLAYFDELNVGGGTWGSITGTLSDQTDLQAALDLKLTTSTLTASIVPVSPSVNSLTNVQAVLEDHETRISGLAAGGSDGVITNAALNTTSIDFTGTGGGFNGSVDLEPSFVTVATNQSTISGQKTWTNLNTFNSSVDIRSGNLFVEDVYLSPHTPFAGTLSGRVDFGVDATYRVYFHPEGGTANAYLNFNNVSADREYIFPDKSGTIAMLDDVGGGGGTWGSITGTLSAQTDLQSALDAKEDDLGNPASDGFILSSTAAGVRSWIAPPTSAVWGNITGTLSAQTDLQAALDAKADSNIYSADGSLTGTRTVDLNGNQINFDNAGAAVRINNGRLGVSTEVFGPTRLGDSLLQAASIDVQSINFKDNSQNTVQAIFQNPSFTVTTHKNFASTVNVNSFSSLEAIKGTENAESTLGLRIDYTNSEFYVTDLGVQDYSPSSPGTLVEDVHFQVLINGGSAVAKPYWFGRYDETTYTTIFEADTSNVVTFAQVTKGQDGVAAEDFVTKSQLDAVEAKTPVVLTQAAYDALSPPDPDTIYVISDSNTQQVDTANASSVAGSVNITGREGNVYYITLTEPTTIENPSNPIPNTFYQFNVYQDASGLHSLSFGSNFKFPDGVVPSIDLNADSKNVYTAFYDGTDFLCNGLTNFL